MCVSPRPFISDSGPWQFSPRRHRQSHHHHHHHLILWLSKRTLFSIWNQHKRTNMSATIIPEKAKACTTNRLASVAKSWHSVKPPGLFPSVSTPWSQTFVGVTPQEFWKASPEKSQTLLREHEDHICDRSYSIYTDRRGVRSDTRAIYVLLVHIFTPAVKLLCIFSVSKKRQRHTKERKTEKVGSDSPAIGRSAIGRFWKLPVFSSSDESFD